MPCHVALTVQDLCGHVLFVHTVSPHSSPASTQRETKQREKAYRDSGKVAKPLWEEDGRQRTLLDKYDEEEEQVIQVRPGSVDGGGLKTALGGPSTPSSLPTELLLVTVSHFSSILLLPFLTWTTTPKPQLGGDGSVVATQQQQLQGDVNARLKAGLALLEQVKPASDYYTPEEMEQVRVDGSRVEEWEWIWSRKRLAEGGDVGKGRDWYDVGLQCAE